MMPFKRTNAGLNAGRHRPVSRPPKCPKQIQAPPTEMSGPATTEMKLVTQSSDHFFFQWYNDLRH